MSVIQNITLDVNQISMFSYINAKQADSGRILRCRITVDGVPYDVPTSATVVFRAIKPDDTFIYNDGTVNSDGTVSVSLTGQTLACVGKVFADIAVKYGNTTVSSVSFVIYVREIPGNDTIVSSSEFSVLSSLISNISVYDSTLTNLRNNKANGPGITVDLNNDILTVTEVS